ncbi:MAG: tetratricopeptide repeat protein [Parvibaculaceae bacterium]|nr:tetratricopeptide repeat protein [Parvibaculaceae bacterium]
MIALKEQSRKTTPSDGGSHILPTQPRGTSTSRRRLKQGVGTVLIALSLTGCMTLPNGKPLFGGASAAKASYAPVHSNRPQDMVAMAAYWGALYEQDPDNAEAAANYGRALRQIGSKEQAHSVLKRAVDQHSSNTDVLAEYGKLLTSVGKSDQAVHILGKATHDRPDDWTLFSALGVALDQVGKHEDALVNYDQALSLSPNNPKVLSNKGLSQALVGDLNIAELTLRKAVSDPASGVQARQNLSLVLGLQGNFGEAERLARADLPPAVATNNISYLKGMLVQPALWKQMEQLDAPIADETF